MHKIIYLIFNEGYKASSGKEIIRQELCEESLIMTKSLLDNHVSNSDTAALYALLLFNAARLSARITPAGELSDLGEQDRALWNDDLIALGSYYLNQSKYSTISSYHYEAAIAYLHCHAKSFADTDWASITQLYRQLLQNNPNPFIELNYAIAFTMIRKSKALMPFTICSKLSGSVIFTACGVRQIVLAGRGIRKSDLHLTKPCH